MACRVAADRLVDAVKRKVGERVGADVLGDLVDGAPWATISSRVDMSTP